MLALAGCASNQALKAEDEASEQIGDARKQLPGLHQGSVLNDLDRFHLFGDVLDRLPQLGSSAAYAKQFIRDKLLEHKHYIAEHGEDMPEIRNWKWAGIQ